MASAPFVLHFGRYRDLTFPLAALVREECDARLRRDGPAELLRNPVEIIVASRASAQALAAELLRGSPGALAGVEMRSLESFAGRLLNRSGSFPRVPSNEEQRLAMAAALADARPPLSAAPGIVPLLLRSWRDLRDGDRTISDFEKGARKGDRERAGAIAHAFKRFDAALGRIGGTDAADVLRLAAAALEEGAAPSISPQIVFGFYDATPVQERLLFALHRAGALHSLWIPAPLENGQRPADYRFADRFVETVERLGRSQAEAPLVVDHSGTDHAAHDVSRFATDADEGRAVFARIGALLDAGVPPSRIGVVARTVDARLLAIAEREAREHGVPLAAAAGRPLLSHPFARTLRDLLRLRREGFPRDLVIELAGAPFRDGFLPLGASAADLDFAARRAEIAAGGSAAILALLPHLDPGHYTTPRVEIYANTVAALERLVAGVEDSKRPAAWADWIETTLARFRLATEEDLDALAALSSLAATLRRADRIGGIIAGDAIAALIADAPDLLPSRSAGPAVWFGDVMSFRGRSFDHVFAIAMRQDLFPQRRSEDLLFTNADRRHAHVRLIDDGRLEERLLFRLIRDGATGGVHFSWAAGDGMRASWRPSVLLKQLELEREPDPALRSEILSRFETWVDQRAPQLAERAGAGEHEASAMRDAVALAEPALRQLRLFARAGTNGPHDGFLAADPLLASAIDAKLGALSPGRLETFGHCPHRFLLQTILGIDTIDEPEIELELTMRKKGTLDHTLLERFYRDLPEREIEAAAGIVELPWHLQQRLSRLVTEEFDAYDARYPAPSPLLRRIERRMVQRSLEEFLVADLNDLAETGFRPWRFETTFGRTDRYGEPEFPAARIPIGDRELILRGRIDRIDRSSDGTRIRVVDYKLGGNRFDKLETSVEKGHLLQLALYALAAVGILGFAPSSVSAAIKPIRGTERATRSFDLGERHAPIMRALETFLGAMLAGRFPAVVSGTRDDHCRYCAVERWCRTRHSPEETWAVKQCDSALELLTELDVDHGSLIVDRSSLIVGEDSSINDQRSTINEGKP
jgi:RecB family exonuclease